MSEPGAGEPVPKLSRQARRQAERQALKRPPAATTPAQNIAAVVPTHTNSDLPHATEVTPGRWIGLADVSAWHEAGHAVAYLHFGLRVYLVTIEPQREGGAGICRGNLPQGSVFGRFGREKRPRWYQGGVIHAAVMMAGPVAVNAVRTGLGFSQPLVAEMLSPADEAYITRALAAIPGVSRAAFEQNGRNFASYILGERRQAFGAIVAALVEHRTLDEAQILAIWEAA